MLELAGRLASTIRSTLWVQNVVVVFHFVDGWFPGDNDLSINGFSFAGLENDFSYTQSVA
jgi:hypothetical protein